MKNGLVGMRGVRYGTKAVQRFSLLVVFAAIAFVLFAFSSLAFAQVETSEVLGTVRDASGATVAQASVVLAIRVRA